VYIERLLSKKIVQLSKGFPVVYVTGPRQSGKSTMLKHVFSEYGYANLEDPDIRAFAVGDPRGFLAAYRPPLVIDEAQQAPSLFSYIQTAVDQADTPGMYILSGSRNFLMLRSVSQSLAGRAAVTTLLPLSYEECADWQNFGSTQQWMRLGGYPGLLTAGDRIEPSDFFQGYVSTYINGDIRQETGVRNILKFRSFLNVCAARTGTLVNYEDMGKAVGADSRTVASWLAMLEESYIVFRLKPWTGNIGKNEVRRPKLYFHDTGLLCHLLGIGSDESLLTHPMRGYIFENAVICEAARTFVNCGKKPRIHFWRDSKNKEREIDLLIDRAGVPSLYEIKNSMTANPAYARNINSFAANGGAQGKYIVYDGPDGITSSGARYTNWRQLGQIIAVKS